MELIFSEYPDDTRPGPAAGGGAGAHSLLGLGPLVAEMQAQGIAAEALLLGTGLSAPQIGDPRSRLSSEQKLRIFRNARRLSRTPDLGLRAGARTRLSDFGLYGYALVSSPTFGDAIVLGMRHLKLAGPMLEKRFRVEGDTACFEGHDVMTLGDVLPLATEYWFSTVHRLMCCVLEAPMPSRQLLLPYPRPAHAAAYERLFGCPVRFDAGIIQWQFDAAVLAAPCPNANQITAEMCAQTCERMLRDLPEESDLERAVRTACLNSCGDFPSLEQMAARLSLSTRTLQRRLSQEGRHYQGLVDEVRGSLAIEFLSQTGMSVEEIGQRLGFSDASNFRKAFRKWTGQAPGHYRATAAAAAAALA